MRFVSLAVSLVAGCSSSGLGLPDVALGDADAGERRYGPCDKGFAECVTAFPYEHEGTTVGGYDQGWDSYSCAPDIDESGPMTIYEVMVPEGGVLTAELTDVSAGADPDVHILDALDTEACLGRGHWEASAYLERGHRFVVVDSWNGDGNAGDYTLTLDFVPVSTSVEDELLGFIGSACEADADCDYDGGVCLGASDGFPNGMCSVSCDQYCDDADGYPTTFCVQSDGLPVAADDLGGGACVSRCDFGAYPYSGCRDGYGCIMEAREGQEDVDAYTCIPNATPALSECLSDLAHRGVPFEPTLLDDASPSSHPSLTCHVEEPVRFHSGYEGVDLLYHTGSGPGTVLGSCAFGHSLADTLEGLADDGVTAARHLGTYNCRVIGGTDTLSQHGMGDAIDLWGFDFEDSSLLTLEDHWEHDTTSPSAEEASWLYDTAYGWFDAKTWNVILTPNYNLAHDNHFHVDLKPGSDFIGFTDGRVFGPMEVVD